MRGLSRFGTSPNGLTGKPYAFGPFVVELFTVPGFAEDPRARSMPGSAPYGFGSSLRQPGSRKGFTLRRPLDGICDQSHAPALHHRGLDSLVRSQRHVPVAPLPRRRNVSGRSLELSSQKQSEKGLRQTAPVEHGQAILMASGSKDNDILTVD